jgi:hypothetical protein
MRLQLEQEPELKVMVLAALAAGLASLAFFLC